ncbi:MAG: hypothetical protein Q4B32_00970 [Clostridia bacterium]|nr:hypothetical protein [Clostridia bacterium]
MKRILCVLVSLLLVWLQLPCCYASSQDVTSESSLSWLMELYGFTMPQDVTTFAQTNFQPLTIETDGIVVSVQEILYDGVWLFTSATAQPSSDDVIIVPFEAEVNDPIAGGYGENLREDSRTFLEAAQEEQKNLLLVSVMPAEYEQADFYFLDHRQDAGSQSTLFSGAPVALQGDDLTIHIAVETTLISYSTGETLSEARHEYSVTIKSLSTYNEKEYLPATDDAPVEKLVLVQTDLATYVYPSWKESQAEALPEYVLTDAEGNPYPSGIPQDANSYSFDVLPDTVYVHFTEETGEEYTAMFTANP